jgi:hypothetical protein
MKKIISVGFFLALLAGLSFGQNIENVRPRKALAYKRLGQDVCVMRTSMGTMVFKFFDADAPKTVAQFKKLVAAGFYDGKDFYRVVKGHVIQTGGGDAPKLAPEFNKNPHLFGTLGLGRTGDENSGDSEIYV